jgi:unsaturated rhamnogalacturonyl hydrolase
MKVATRGWEGIKKEFIKTNEKGETDWEGTVSVSGLGGNPYRDGSFEYYMSEKLRTNDAKGLGPAIRAALEMESYERGLAGTRKDGLLDDYFNHEMRKSKNFEGEESWHYKWDERPDAGFYAWSQIFRSLGAKTATLSAAPTAASLADVDVYIIVDPDNAKETANPNFVESQHMKAIADWVKSGGVLVLMGNDVQSAELDKFNLLAKEFGIEFNKDRKFEVLNNDYKMGGIDIAPNNEIFKTAKKIFVKEVSTLSPNGKAKAVVTANGDTIMAVAKHGKGTVFVIGDPWIYNEYLDGRRLPAEFETSKQRMTSVAGSSRMRGKDNSMKITAAFIFLCGLATIGLGQARQPSAPSAPFYIKSHSQIDEITKELEKQKGNQNRDIFPAKGGQMRVAVFHDEKRGKRPLRTSR